jgi:hypothetical protein
MFPGEVNLLFKSNREFCLVENSSGKTVFLHFTSTTNSIPAESSHRRPPVFTRNSISPESRTLTMSKLNFCARRPSPLSGFHYPTLFTDQNKILQRNPCCLWRLKTLFV